MPFEKYENRDGKVLLKRLYHDYLKPFKRRMVFAGFLMVLVAATTAANAWLMQPILDDIFLNKKREMLMLIPIAVLVIFTVKALATYGQNLILQIMGQRILATMQQQLYRHLIHADIGLFSQASSGRLISRFTNDIYIMRQSVSTLFTGMIKEVLTLIFLVAVMLYQSWELALIAVVIFPVTAWPIMCLGKRMRKISGQTQANLSEFAGQLDETFAGVRLVKAYAQEDREIEKAGGMIESLYELYAKAAKVQSAASPMMELFTGFVIAGIIGWGGAQVMDGTTTPGMFFSFITALIMAYKPAKTLAGMNTQLQEGMAAASRLFSVLDMPAAVMDKPDAAPLSVDKGALVLADVSFQYPDDSGIEGVSITVPAGSSVALVGPSGGGKSTLMNLLLRFYDPQSGTISIDGTDIRDVTQGSLRKHIALVSQETVLFDDTVGANIAYGLPDADQATIEQAAKDAAAHEFIMAMPEGYETRVGPRGVKLSGGQRQRLAIARALLKDAPILLLDEATSALDTQSESLVQAAIDRLMKGRTCVIVAHRLSTIAHVDKVYVMDGGQIVESGTHKQLQAKKGLFHQLYAA
ncbi:MAG: ABC transporter ATP-binding protein [Rickettsiales bacterium]|nr:ABC transporter ATP-binding protein [Rickettsiales bacterium]